MNSLDITFFYINYFKRLNAIKSRLKNKSDIPQSK
ncbi:MAG: hypothetical protein ACI81W_004261 [Saprospiraceae bacterium]|jgi:hypothetical protein